MKTDAKKIKATVCDCGGHLQPAMLATFDFSAMVGFKVLLRDVPGLRCDKCGYETVDGKIINQVMGLVVIDFARSTNRLNGDEARYLRRMLNATQQELAARMGVRRETVAKWECGDEIISPQHDFILRVLSLTSFIAAGHMRRADAEAIMATVRAVRSDPPRQEISVDLTGLKPFKPSRRRATG